MVLLKLGGSQSWPASLLSFHKPNDLQLTLRWCFGPITAFDHFCWLMNFGQDSLLLNLALQVPPRKPAKNSKLPKKGTIITKKLHLKNWGTVRSILSWNLPDCCSQLVRPLNFRLSGVFGSTVRANPKYLSSRGAGVQLACLKMFVVMCSQRYSLCHPFQPGLRQSSVLVHHLHSSLQEGTGQEGLGVHTCSCRTLRRPDHVILSTK